MQELMQKREAMKEWFENKKKEFEALLDDLKRKSFMAQTHFNLWRYDEFNSQ